MKEKEFKWMGILLFIVSLFMFNLSWISMLNKKNWFISWSIIDSFSVSFLIYMDWMSILFFGLVSLISSCVVLYSGSYMEKDKNISLFSILVFMFIMSMFFLVFSLNLISIMLGWDGLGIISYILVIYYHNEKSSAAGMLTALSNRIGDTAILLGIAYMVEFGSWNFMFMEYSKMSFMLFIVVAAMTKSAQIPFSAWLPAAMSAPTPVSALVHSSTLVTAGVYLLIRFSPFMMESYTKNMLVYVGILTTFMASLSAMYEVDLKKVVALSTLSQLGIMVSTVGLGLVQLSFMHLLTHAVFKSLLFMSSGKIIHSIGNNQDMRNSGGLLYNLPVTSMIMNLSNLALCGIPFLSGFYSKDLIMEISIMKDMFLFKFIMYMFVISLSICYSFRFSFLTLISLNSQSTYCKSDEEDYIMLSSKVLLTAGSIVLGALLFWSIFNSYNIVVLPFFSTWFVVISMVMGMIMSFVILLWSSKGLFLMNYMNMEVFFSMWFLPYISGSLLANKVLEPMSKIMWFDQGWLEYYMGRGVYVNLNKLSSYLTVSLFSPVKFMLAFFVVICVSFV